MKAHHRIQIYIARRGEGEWAWLTAPAKPPRKYGESTSTPGRICKTDFCRAFVAGPRARPCPSCGLV